jgi:mono/diheme cytochrome c family protein
MAAWVLYGVRPASLPRGGYSGVMPQFNFLSDADAAAVITYVRTSFSNAASPITAGEIAAVRARYSTP